MINKIVSSVIVILAAGIALYLFLLSRSIDEKNGDNAFESKEFRHAIVFYKKALADNKVSFSEERILFKLGNSYRLAGENQRAFDFYFAILRRNSNSVYRDRIQTYLRHEASDLESLTTLREIELDLSFLKQDKQLSLLELKGKRDELYSVLLKKLSEFEGESIGYRLIDLYESYSKLQVNYQSRKKTEIRKVDQLIKRRVKRRLGTYNLEPLSLPDLSSLSEFYQIEQLTADSWTDLYTNKKFFSMDGFFINASEENHTNLLIHLQRLYDFHEKAKVFLIFDDNILKGLSREQTESFAKYASLLNCGKTNPCAEVIRQLVNRRSLWQSGG